MILYILKSASCLALLLFFYHFILEKEKMHHFNRFYLLGSIVFSFLVPLATITIPSAPEIVESVQNFNQTVLAESTAPTLIEESYNYGQLFTGIYLLIATILFIRFGRNLFKIIQKIRLNEKIKYQNATLVLVEDNILPHTFWKFIFINKKNYKKGIIEEELFTHELTHVTQKHTVDVLFIEILQIVFWINPLFIFLKKAIQLNHEFLADETVINQHKNTFQYQHLLLHKAAWNNEYYLASNLNYSLTKKRLKMMTTQSSQTKIVLKKLAVIPLVIGFIFLFAERVEAQETVYEQPKNIQKTHEKLSESDLYKDFTHRNSTITYKDKDGKKITKQYREMSRKERDAIKSSSLPLKRKKKIPTKKLIEGLKDNSKYAIWIDGKAVENEVLNNYKNTDFSNFIVSFVHKNARSKRFPQEYQAHLDTHTYFETQNKKRIENFENYKKEQQLLHKAKWQSLPNGEKIKVVETPKKEYLDAPIPSKQSGSDIQLKLKDVNNLKKKYQKNNSSFVNDEKQKKNINKKVESTISNFKIQIEKKGEIITLKCSQGCAWKELDFTIQENRHQAIDYFGMTDLNSNSTNSSFKFILTESNQVFTLKSIKGTTWKGLSFSANENQKLLINQYGVKSINDKDIKYYLDDKPITEKEMELLPTEKIASVDVRKNKDGSGSVYITTKK